MDRTTVGQRGGVEIDDVGSIRVLRIVKGKAATLDVEFLQEFLRHLNDFEESDSTALVITGVGRVFSAGVDLRRILDGGESYRDEFLPLMSEAFLRLFRVEKPTVAAVNGHAIAGGCIITCACDHRVMADGEGKIGISELDVGVPFPTVPLEIMRFVLPSHTFSQVVWSAMSYSPHEARESGLVDQVVSPDSLLEIAVTKAQELAAVPPDVYRVTKRQLREPALERIDDLRQRFDAEVESMWSSGPVLDAIESFLERLRR